MDVLPLAMRRSMALHLRPSRSFLDQLMAHSSLTEREQEVVSSLPAHSEQVQTNRDFVRLGERVEHSCFVLEGLVGRFSQNRDGMRQIVAVHIPGDMADLHSVVVPKAGWALSALAPTTILKVPHQALREAGEEYPALTRAFWRQCVIDGCVLAEWVVNVGRRDALSSLAHLICEIACRVLRRIPRDGDEIPFPATQHHLADMLGLTPVHVNRTLQQLRGHDVVAEPSRRVLTILDWRHLAGLGDFDPAYLHLPSDEVPALADGNSLT